MYHRVRMSIFTSYPLLLVPQVQKVKSVAGVGFLWENQIPNDNIIRSTGL